MKRDVTKLTKNTYYIDMEEYYGEDSIKRISEKEGFIGKELIEYLYYKLYREFKMFLESKMIKESTFDKNGYCIQVLIIEYDKKTWVHEVILHKHMQHHYIDCHGVKYTNIPLGKEKNIMKEEDNLVVDATIRLLE